MKRAVVLAVLTVVGLCLAIAILSSSAGPEMRYSTRREIIADDYIATVSVEYWSVESSGPSFHKYGPLWTGEHYYVVDIKERKSHVRINVGTYIPVAAWASDGDLFVLAAGGAWAMWQYDGIGVRQLRVDRSMAPPDWNLVDGDQKRKWESSFRLTFCNP